MTREEAKELMPIIQAFVEGKTIEYRGLGGEWKAAHTPTWSSHLFYRIKPEPKYRPFRSREECWQEMNNHSDFGWLTRIDTGNFEHINTVCQEKIRFAVSIEYYRYEDAFKYYKFPDGTPFGIKED